MKILICIKEVPDPDGVNAFALAGRLQIDPETYTPLHEGIPLVMNGFDAQAIEAALRIRDAGVPCEVQAISLGAREPVRLFQYAFALGVDQGYHIADPALGKANGALVSRILAQAVRRLGGFDLILCGRQASDDDQGVVGPGLAALLGWPCVTIARDIRLASDDAIHVTRILPDGEEVVEARLPAVVTISNEVGQPRFPTVRALMAARRKSPAVLSLSDIGIDPQQTDVGQPVARLVNLTLAQIQGRCELIKGSDAREMAANLARRLRAEGLI